MALLLARAAAAFPTSRLVYVRGPGAEECPDQDVVRRAVAARLGYDPFFPNSDKTIIARVLREPQRLRGEVELVDERGTRVGLREFSANLGECQDLVHAMALSISIAIDPKSAETYRQGPSDEPAPASEPEATEPGTPAPSPVPVAKPEQSTRAAAEPSIVASAGLGALAAFQVLPKTTFGLVASGALRYRAWSIALEGEADLPTTDQGVRGSSFALRLVPCGHLGIGFACPVTAVRWLSATRIESNVDGGTSALVAFGARVGLEVRLGGSFSGLSYAELMATPTKVSLMSQDHELWKTPVLSGSLAIAAAFHFR
jgi:hypothetical protein